MEKYVCDTDCIIDDTQIKKGTEFPVLRNIRNECILITEEHELNIITTEKQLKHYGTLSGTPSFGGI